MKRELCVPWVCLLLAGCATSHPPKKEVDQTAVYLFPICCDRLEIEILAFSDVVVQADPRVPLPTRKEMFGRYPAALGEVEKVSLLLAAAAGAEFPDQAISSTQVEQAVWQYALSGPEDVMRDGVWREAYWVPAISFIGKQVVTLSGKRAKGTWIEVQYKDGRRMWVHMMSGVADMAYLQDEAGVTVYGMERLPEWQCPQILPGFDKCAAE